VRVDDSHSNARACICPDCPTFDTCAGDAKETLYCARGVSSCELSQQGCICAECTVWSMYELDDYYYCINGAAT
jgi:hypothetical protein